MLIVARRGDVHFLNVHALLPAAVSKRLSAARAINQNVAHRLSGGGEEVRAIGKLRTLTPDQAQPGFMHERRGLQCLTPRSIRHFVRGQPPQFVVDQRKQLTGSGQVALLNAIEDTRDVAHKRGVIGFDSFTSPRF